MNALVMLFGASIVAAGAWTLARPEGLLAFVDRLRAPGALWGIAALRLVMGVVLVSAAAGTRWPAFIEVLGWLAIVSGVITPFFAGERLHRLLEGWTSRPPGLIRAWGVVALALGGALVFAGT